MKFGAVPDHLLSSIDLRLPPEPAGNQLVLPGIRVAQPKVYVGAARWGDTSWVGNIYPLKTPSAKFRQLYPQHFNAVELNATHYTIYTVDVLQQWAAAAKEKDFKFCPKFPQQISHHSDFKNTDALTHAFLESIRAFGAQLGPAFLQVSEYFAPVHQGALLHYLQSLPKDLTFFLEVRHPQWFEAKTSESLFTHLKEAGIGAVITDAPGRRDVVHMHLTLPKLFLRFVCNGVHSSSFSRTDRWIEKIQHWMELGMDEVYVFLHPGNDAAIPELATYWVEQLNRRCHLHLQPPVSSQRRLF
jgi:uncharacterized protein YecE (DUF72 family)